MSDIFEMTWNASEDPDDKTGTCHIDIDLLNRFSIQLESFSDYEYLKIALNEVAKNARRAALREVSSELDKLQKTIGRMP